MGGAGCLLTATIWSHSVTPGSCLYADPIRHSWSSTAANRSNRAFSRSTSLITPTTWKCNSSTFSGNLGPNQPSLSFTSKPDLGLSLDHLADLGIGEEITDLRLVVPLDDERFVELGVAHLDVLHAQELAQVAEEALPVDRESEALGVDVRGTHAGCR